MNSQLQRRLQFTQEQDSHVVQLSYLADGWEIACDGAQHRLNLVSQQGPELVLRLGASTVSGTVVRDGEHFHVFSQGVHSVFHYLDALAHAGEAEAEGGRLTAPMPGKIVAVLVTTGQSVTKGSALLIMEAMKMEHTISAPHDGIIAEVLYAVGDQVGEGAQLLAFAQPV